MKNSIVMLVMLVTLLVAGCSVVRQQGVDLSVENIKNAEAIREISLNCISVWPIQSGFIKGVLGDRINELPAETLGALKELDRLAEQTEQTDYELGWFLGTKVRILKFVIQTAIEKYVPDIVEFLKIVF